ncbi:MAG: HrcA family transcriptional regulator [Wolinella sp.]
MQPRKSLLLDEIIREYVKQQEPIGSESLRLLLGIKISSATIRNHFRALIEEGALMQPHVSSGRIPTEIALKEYWRKRLPRTHKVEFKSMQNLERSAHKVGIFCALRFYNPNFFTQLTPIKDRFLLLSFSEGEVVLKYSNVMERFMDELLGLEIRELYKVARQLCVHELTQKLEQLLNQEPFFSFGLGSLADRLLKNREGEGLFQEILQGKMLDMLQEGLYFEQPLPRGNLAAIERVKVGQNEAKLMLVGALNRDYEGFYHEALG